jgi:hypothetical protein
MATYVDLTGVSGPQTYNDPALHTVVSVLPAWVNFTISYGNVNATLFQLSATNTTVLMTIYNVSSGTNYMVYSVPIITGQAGYSVMLDQSFLGCSTATCLSTMTGTYSFSLWVQIDATGAQGTMANNSDMNFDTTTWVATLPTYINTVTYGSGLASGPAKYSTLPAWINFTIRYGGVGPAFAISSSTVSVWLSTLNEVTHAKANYSVPIVAGQSSYSLEITATSDFGCTQANCTAAYGTLNDTLSWNLWPSIDGTAYRGGMNNNGTLFIPLAVSSFILFAPTFSVSAPGTINTVGNITITANYTAQFVTNAVVNVFAPATLSGGAATLVFTASYLHNVSNDNAISHVWFAGTAASYFVSFVVTLDYENAYVNGTIAVLPATPTGGGVIYQNSTVYKNVTGGTTPAGFFGLSPAASGTVFLLVGLIVGILAGLVAARLVMSSGPAKPAQPWTEKKEETSNTCSVCGKSFGSADELAAHSKSEHGMQ